MMTSSSRRQFLSSAAATSTVMTFGSIAPAVLQRAAEQKNGERILVVVEMAGGNDGLNTVIPYGHDAYKKSRPKLAISGADVMKIGNGLGLHPSCRGLSELLENAHLAIVQGVGYPNPNQSHFESMDIWHTCQRKNDNRTDGWIGRFLDGNKSSSTDPPALHFGEDKQPFALTSRLIRVPSIRSLDQFRLEGNDSRRFREAVKSLSDARRESSNDLLGFVQSSTSSAITASERIGSAGMKNQSADDYPTNGLAKKLQTVSQLIKSGLGTSVYYVEIGGFDTHAQQANAHSALLRHVSESVSAFIKDMIASGHGDRVLCMCFSEFGRRVKENASEGTDHGTAGPIFLAGTKVKAGLIGRHPNLSKLSNGDLRYHTDFRKVYATVLSQWLNCDTKRVLKGDFEPIDALKSV